MSERGIARARVVRRVLQDVKRLREQGADARAALDPELPLRARYRRDEPPAPPGGWKPILDDDGNVIPDPPPSEPTDTPPAGG